MGDQVTYHQVMTAPERQRVTQQDEILRDAAAERLGEAGPVIVLRPSDAQLRREVEEMDADVEARQP